MKLEKRLKRLLSLTLTLSMILSIVQFTSLAAATNEGPYENVVYLLDGEALDEEYSDASQGETATEPADEEEVPAQSGEEAAAGPADEKEYFDEFEDETVVESEDEEEYFDEPVDEGYLPDEDRTPALPEKEYWFTIRKVDADDYDTALADAEFLLFREDGSLYSERIYRTGKNGEVEVGNLPAGVYYLVELEAPDGYVRTNDYWKIIAGTPDTSAGFADVRDLMLAALKDLTDNVLVNEGAVPSYLANGGTLSIKNVKSAVNLAGESLAMRSPAATLNGEGMAIGTREASAESTGVSGGSNISDWHVSYENGKINLTLSGTVGDGYTQIELNTGTGNGALVCNNKSWEFARWWNDIFDPACTTAGWGWPNYRAEVILVPGSDTFTLTFNGAVTVKYVDGWVESVSSAGSSGGNQSGSSGSGTSGDSLEVITPSPYKPHSGVGTVYVPGIGNVNLASPAHDFHVFAEKYTISAHTYGHFAVNDLVANAGFNTPQNQTDEIVYIGNSITGDPSDLSSDLTENDKLVLGPNFTDYQIGYNNGLGITIGGRNYNSRNWVFAAEEGYLDVSAELSNLVTLSNRLLTATPVVAKENIDTILADSGSGDIWNINVPKKPDGVVVLDLDAGKLSGKKWWVYTEDTQTVIINVDVTNTKELGEVRLNRSGSVIGHEHWGKGRTHNVLWNFYKTDPSTGKKVALGAGDAIEVGAGAGVFVGTVLAPGAKVTFSQLNGSVIAQEAVQTGNESHGGLYFQTVDGDHHDEEINPIVQYAPKVDKRVEGFSDDKAPAFKFRLEFVSGDPSGGCVPPEDTEIEINNITKQKNYLDSQFFDQITFKLPGTYQFKIYEVLGDDSDWDYDDTVWLLTVTVTERADKSLQEAHTYTAHKRGENGTLGDPIKDANDNLLTRTESAEFTNTYTDEERSGEYTPKIDKYVTAEGGSTILPGPYTFTFNIADETDYEAEGAPEAKAGLPENGTITVEVKVENGQVKKEETRISGAITFTKPGSYKFIITEALSGLRGWTSDTDAEWTLEIKVEKDLNDPTRTRLKVTSEIYKDGAGGTAGAASFTNTYRDPDGAYQPKFTKTVTTVDNALLPNESYTFRFTLASKGATDPDDASHTVADAVLPEETEREITVGKDEVGAVKPGMFDAITFSDTGVYTFWITEELRNELGWTYDKTIWVLTVTVVEDEENNRLAVDDFRYDAYEAGDGGTLGARIIKDGEPVSNDFGAEFINTYKKTTFTPDIVKTATDAEFMSAETQKFQFAIEQIEAKDPDGNNLPQGAASPAEQSAVVTVGKDGSVDLTEPFGAITFTEAGTYKFRITEVNDGASGWSYDKTVWILTVEVGPDLENPSGTYNAYTAGRRGYLRPVIDEQTRQQVTSTEQATFTNKYETGGLIVKKTVSGKNGNAADYAADFYDKVFKFTVTLEDKTINGDYGDMKFKDGVAEIELEHGKTAEATGLPAGIKYTVTETDVQRYFTVRYTRSLDDTGRGSRGKTAGGVIPPEGKGSAVVHFINTPPESEVRYAPAVKKTVNGKFAAMETFYFEFLIESVTAVDKNGNDLPEGAFRMPRNNTIKVAAKVKAGDEEVTTRPWKFGDIVFKRAGTYTFKVSEIDPNSARWGYDDTKWILTVVVAVDDTTGKLVRESVSFAKEGEEGSEDLASFENPYQTGDLSVTKTVKNIEKVGNANQRFNFTVRLSDKKINGTYGDLKFKHGVASFTLQHGETKTATGLPAGITYKITEDNYTGYGYTTGGTAQGQEFEGRIAEGTIVVEGAQVEFTNTYESGDLSVTKTVKNAEDTDLKKDFTFTVKLYAKINGTYGDMTFRHGKATFKLKHGETKTATGLPAGIRYEITERDNEGYVVKWTGKTDTGKIIKDDVVKAECVNERFDGSLIVSKTVSGMNADYDKPFHFKVTLSDGSINGLYGISEDTSMVFKDGVAEFDLSHGQTKTAEGLPAGITYTVEETPDPDYTPNSSVMEGTIGNDRAATAAFVNTLAAGDLTVTKAVIGTGADPNKPFTFTVTLSDDSISGTYGDMTFDGGVAIFTLQDGESRTAIGLPVGVTYEVEESDNEGYRVHSTGATGEISEDSEAVAAFTNTLMTGSLTVRKTVDGINPDRRKAFTFTVTLDDTSISGTYGDMTFTDGVATFTLRHGQSRTARDLPAGVTYQVEETDDGDYYVSRSSGTSGMIVMNGRATASFTNSTTTTFISTIPEWPDIPTFDIPTDRTPLANATFNDFMDINDTQTPLDLLDVNDQTPLDFMDINELETPLDNMEDDLLDLDIDVPLDQFIPQTGDESAIWLIAAAASAIGLVILFFADRKKEEEEA